MTPPREVCLQVPVQMLSQDFQVLPVNYYDMDIVQFLFQGNL